MEIKEQNRERKKWPKVTAIVLQNKMASFITLILVLIAGFREIGIDRDSINYANSIQSIDFSIFSDLSFVDKEPTFYLIAYVAHWLFSDAVRGTFVIYALLGVTLKIIGIYRLSRIPLLSVFFYVSSYYLLHELTQIRVGVASAIFLLAIPDIADRNLKAYMAKTVLATLFHYSAVIMLPLYLILTSNRSGWFYFILPIVGVFFAHSDKYVLNFVYTNMFLLNLIPSFLSHKLINYIDLLQNGVFAKVNIFGFYYLSLMVIYYFCIVNIKRFKSDLDILLIKILGLSLFILYFFSFLPVFAIRISEFLAIVIMILFASIVYIFKQRILIICLILIYTLICFVNIVFIQKYFKLW